LKLVWSTLQRSMNGGAPMAQVSVVLCPIDFSDLSKQEVAVAFEICQAFGARLVLHHNLSAVSPGFTRAWEWNEVHRADEVSTVKAEARLRKILAETPKGVLAEATVSHGPLGTILLQLATQLPADLILLGSHGWSTPDHASVSERIIERSPCPVLTLHEGDSQAPPFRLRPGENDVPVRVVVPTDFSASAQRALDYAFGLARHVPLHLHLLHVLAHRGTEESLQDTARTLDDLVPADLRARTFCHVEAGDPIEHILTFSRQIGAGCIVMGEHARGFVRRFFTRDTSRAVLHRACCPVWFVPPGH
jgi:universal stress protein A